MPRDNVTFRTGDYQDYYDAFIAGENIPDAGCLYYLEERDSGTHELISTHIFLNGSEYGNTGSGSSTQWEPISNQ